MQQPYSINDELQALRQKALALGKTIVRVEKVGNGNMAAFRVFYRDTGSETLKDTFFWRHDEEKLLDFFRNEA